MGGKRWSSFDKRFLETHYFNTPKYEIARLLHRSYHSVLDYAWWHHLSSYQKQYNIGIKQARKIDLSPTFELGCLCGLILGDGSIRKSKTRNYTISLGTTKADFAEYFASVLQEVYPVLTVHRLANFHTRRFPNGTVKTDIRYLVQTDSKILYEAIRPFKQNDYFWQMPEFLTTVESKVGFLRGIFDAEGSVGTTGSNRRGMRYCQISMASKHRCNLLPIQELLLSLDISLHLYTSRNISTLETVKKSEVIKFQKNINFGYLPKKERLEELLWQPKQLVAVPNVATL